MATDEAIRSTGAARRPARAVLCLGLLAVLTEPLSAHVVYQRRTLRQWAQHADVIAVAEILSPLQIWSAPDGSDHQEYFTIRVHRRIAGDLAATSVDVFPHTEGEPRYKVGDRVLLFLDHTAQRPEFAHLAKRFPYFTTQGAGHEWILDQSDVDIPSLAIAWRSLRGGASYAARRDLLIRELQSSNRRLRAEALVELLHLAPSDEFQSDQSTLARIAAMSRSDKLAASERIGLIQLLQGTPGFSAGTDMLRLADQADLDPRQRLVVIRACGTIRDDAVTLWLRQRLRDPDSAVQVAAVAGLGHPWHASAILDLATLATESGVDPDIGSAAVRSLGGIGEPAKAALRDLAQLEQPLISALARREVARLRETNPRQRGDSIRSIEP